MTKKPKKISTAIPKTELMQRLHAKRKEQGLVDARFWIRPEHRPQLEELNQQLQGEDSERINNKLEAAAVLDSIVHIANAIYGREPS